MTTKPQLVSPLITPFVMIWCSFSLCGNRDIPNEQSERYCRGR